MYDVFFYKDKNGKRPIADYMQDLSENDSKDGRIRLNKIYEYLRYLSEVGKQAKEPFAKHLDGEIRELRPLRDRILFAAWDGKSFILLHRFLKQTRKTPKREIEQARRNLADYRERSNDDESK